MAKQPSRDDPSKPKAHGYAYKKQFYQSADVAADYDEHRFRTPKRQRRNARKWDAIQKALALTESVKSIVDLPCGTGRFTGNLARAGFQVVGSDISMEMMQQAAKLPSVQHANIAGYVRADAEALPFGTKSADCVMSIRFLFHVDSETRRRMLREFGRVSRKWIIADYRHKYSLRYGVWKVASTLGLTKRPFERVSVKSMKAEFEDAGLRVSKIIAVRRWLSDKWVVLAEAGHVDPSSLAIKLQGTKYADLKVTEKLGEGKRSVVYRARWRAARSASRSTNPRRSPTTRANTSCRWPNSSIAATAHSSRRAAWRSTWPNRWGSWSSPASRCHCRNVSMARCITSRSAITRTSSRRASWKISPNS